MFALSWTSIIGAYAFNGNWKEAIELFSKMIDEGIRPNGLTFIAVLTACGLVEEGRKHFKSMSNDYFILPGLDAWGALLSVCRIHGNLGLACSALKMLVSISL
ncbi:hypothetical protein L1987_28304 [Smallanthus sonchifolius]|uniref:Uncharacterized protein n=1 Tax=Smallanthus sonchifolius TaxID=185202 RepID=A0ACB9IE79_9ASTR|nr:hypothetical protein L1987_28304 [Smallanthus sonchifolius]